MIGRLPRGAGMLALIVVVVLLTAVALGFYVYLHNIDELGVRGFLMPRTHASLMSQMGSFAPEQAQLFIAGDFLLDDSRLMSRSLVQWAYHQGWLAPLLPRDARNVQPEMLDLLNGQFMVASWPAADGPRSVLVLGVRDGVRARDLLKTRLDRHRELPLLGSSLFMETSPTGPGTAFAVIYRYVVISNEKDGVQVALECFKHRLPSILDSSRFRNLVQRVEGSHVAVAYADLKRLLPPPRDKAATRDLDGMAAGLWKVHSGLAGRAFVALSRSAVTRPLHKLMLQKTPPLVQSTRLLPQETAAYASINPPLFNYVAAMLGIPPLSPSDLLQSAGWSEAGLQEPTHLQVFEMAVAQESWDALAEGLVAVHQQAAVRECSSNLRWILDACRQYQSRTGRYPQTLSQLVPRYLPEVPLCPATQRPTYGEAGGYQASDTLDSFEVRCAGTSHQHAGVPPNFPSLSSERDDPETGAALQPASWPSLLDHAVVFVRARVDAEFTDPPWHDVSAAHTLDGPQEFSFYLNDNGEAQCAVSNGMLVVGKPGEVDAAAALWAGKADDTLAGPGFRDLQNRLSARAFLILGCSLDDLALALKPVAEKQEDAALLTLCEPLSHYDDAWFGAVLEPEGIRCDFLLRLK